MSLNTSEELDDTGKVTLDHIYNQSDPRLYFSTLRKLEYFIPQHAKPTFLNILQAYKETRRASCTKVVDLGCSYGINAALLKYGMTMEGLYQLYGTPEAEGLDRRELIERDREIFTDDAVDRPMEFVGVDAAPKAAAYAEEAEIIDNTIVADLELENLTSTHQDSLDDASLVISTGCVGYISETTIEKVVEASTDGDPWMAHYVLRMFPFDAIKDAFAEKDYVTAKGTNAVRQRKFASRLEKEQVLDRLVDLGIDPSGFETEGWYYADLYISRPISDTSHVPCSALISS